MFPQMCDLCDYSFCLFLPRECDFCASHRRHSNIIVVTEFTLPLLLSLKTHSWFAMYCGYVFDMFACFLFFSKVWPKARSILSPVRSILLSGMCIRYVCVGLDHLFTVCLIQRKKSTIFAAVLIMEIYRMDIQGVSDSKVHLGHNVQKYFRWCFKCQRA